MTKIERKIYEGEPIAVGDSRMDVHRIDFCRRTDNTIVGVDVSLFTAENEITLPEEQPLLSINHTDLHDYYSFLRILVKQGVLPYSVNVKFESEEAYLEDRREISRRLWELPRIRLFNVLYREQTDASVRHLRRCVEDEETQQLYLSFRDGGIGTLNETVAEINAYAGAADYHPITPEEIMEEADILVMDGI